MLLEYLGIVRRYFLLPMVYALFLLFGLVIGLDSYNLALNALVLLFIVQVDNVRGAPWLGKGAA